MSWYIKDKTSVRPVDLLKFKLQPHTSMDRL